MDTSFIVVCLIVVSSVFIPFYLFIFAGQSGRKKMKANIKEMVAKYNLNIAESENWGNTYIGLDTNQKKFLFLKITASESLEQLVDLNTVNGFQILEKRKLIKTKGGKEPLLEKLDLEVSLKNSEHILLNFYDADQTLQEDFELQRIQKWKAILIGHILAVPCKKKVA